MTAADEPLESWTTWERTFRRYANRYYKRSLRPSEFKPALGGKPFVPPQGYERVQNEAACLRYIRENTDIPVPDVLDAYDDNGAFVLVTSKVPGTMLADIADPETQRAAVKEVEGFFEKLQNLCSDQTGGPTGIVCPPPRATRYFPKETAWTPHTLSPGEERTVFCHGDLSQSNILVDPDSGKVMGIIDWEFGGFWPSYFEAPYFRSPVPSGRQFGQPSDNAKVVSFMVKLGYETKTDMSRQMSS